MNATGWSRGLEVTGGGTGVVSHAGLMLLWRLADRTGLTSGLSAALPSPLGGHLPVDEQLTHFLAALQENPALTGVLDRAAVMDLPGWYLVAGCLYQTVWNVVTGQPPDAGILDYDLAYFDDSDLSYAAEDTVIREGSRVFSGLPAPVQIRNQARVHLWYEPKYGLPCPPHTSTESAIDTFEATVVCLGVRLEPGGGWRVYAPFGLSDVFNLVARPNPVLAPRHVYQAKTDRWRRQWPGLTVLPWPAPA